MASAGKVTCGQRREPRDRVELEATTDTGEVEPSGRTAGNVEARGAEPYPRHS